jgi:nicotinamidase/pyrazinamidase
MSREIVAGENDVLLVVDIQNDFCPDGALAVPHGDEVVPIVNRLAGQFRHVVLTQDWHPPDHGSFASLHRGRKPFDVIEVAYGPQILWPDHCVQGTEGAEFRADFDVPQAQLIIRKGFRREVDSYSAFRENDHKTPTGLAGYLRERGLTRVFVAGLAFDFCVRYSAEDAHAHGFEVVVIDDACRGIDVDGSVADTCRRLAELDIAVVQSDQIRAA